MGIKQKEFLDALTGLRYVCLDTALFIYHIGRINPFHALTAPLLKDIADKNLSGCISVISAYEFIIKPLTENKPQEVADFEELIFVLLELDVYETTYPIIKRAGGLSARHNIRLPDALIAATALHHNCDALITNDKDLKKLEIEGIKVIALLDYVD